MGEKGGGDEYVHTCGVSGIDMCINARCCYGVCPLSLLFKKEVYI